MGRQRFASRDFSYLSADGKGEKKMQGKKLTRRDFLRLSAMTTAGVVTAACAAPTPVVVEKEKVVTKEVEKEVPVEKVVKETVVVEKPVEKVVEKTKVIEKEVTRVSPHQAPAFQEMVKAGELPPLEERLPVAPMVVKPVDEIGQYGGTWRRAATGLADESGSTTRILYTSLLEWTPEKVPGPGVAKSWEVKEGGKLYILHLREGVKWSDGEPFTADDLMFWFEDVASNEELSPSFASWLIVGGERVKVEKIDDYTVSFRFAKPYGLFPMMLCFAGDWLIGYPKHYLTQFHAKYTPKEELDKKVKDAGFDFWYELFGDKAAYKRNVDLPTLRPWTLKVGPPATNIIYERNPYYWKVDPEGNQLPYIDKVNYTLVEDREMINMRAIAGEIDMQMRNLLFFNYPLFEANKEKGGYKLLKWWTGESGGTLFPNMTFQKDPVLRELLENRDFRVALSLAIDRDQVNELVYLGMAKPVESFFPTSLQQDEELMAPFTTYDVEEANRLLDEIGLTERSADGYRLRPDGKILSLAIDITVTVGCPVEAVELVVGYWEKLGIRTSAKRRAYGVPWGDREIAAYILTRVDPPDGLAYLTWPIDYVPITMDRSYMLYGQWYVTGGKEGEEPSGDLRKAQEIYDEIKTTVDPDKQRELSEEIFRLFLKNVWAIPMTGQYPQPVVVKKNFINVPQEGVWTWPLKAPGYCDPEQFSFKK